MASIKNADERASNQKMLIFLADDDADDRALFQEAFNNVRGLTTELQIFNDGVALLEHLEKPESELAHIIFLDLNMPRKSGIEILRELRANRRFNEVSIAIYSTSNHAHDIEDTFSAGANVYIHKPETFEKLQKVLKHVLKLNWQFHLSGMSKETFFLNI